jgi:hypothetical protein
MCLKFCEPLLVPRLPDQPEYLQDDFIIHHNSCKVHRSTVEHHQCLGIDAYADTMAYSISADFGKSRSDLPKKKHLVMDGFLFRNL